MIQLGVVGLAADVGQSPWKGSEVLIDVAWGLYRFADVFSGLGKFHRKPLFIFDLEKKHKLIVNQKITIQRKSGWKLTTIKHRFLWNLSEIFRS